MPRLLLPLVRRLRHALPWHAGGGGRGARPRCAVRSEQNQRAHNEDSWLIAEWPLSPEGPPLTLLAVADGMGGHSHGEDVSREALKHFGLSLFESLTLEPSLNRLRGSSSLDAEALSRVLLAALGRTNHHVLRMVRNNGWERAGSTIVAAAVLRAHVVAVNLGDSPLFHYSPAGRRLSKITEDHSVSGALLRAGVITPEMARVHEGAGRLECYLGTENRPARDPVSLFKLAPEDVLLLCSDGISGALPEERIAQILRGGDDDLEGTAERLVRESLAAGATDNQTLILWQQQARHRAA